MGNDHTPAYFEEKYRKLEAVTRYKDNRLCYEHNCRNVRDSRNWRCRTCFYADPNLQCIQPGCRSTPIYPNHRCFWHRAESVSGS